MAASPRATRRQIQAGSPAAVTAHPSARTPRSTRHKEDGKGSVDPFKSLAGHGWLRRAMSDRTQPKRALAVRSGSIREEDTGLRRACVRCEHLQFTPANEDPGETANRRKVTAHIRSGPDAPPRLLRKADSARTMRLDNPAPGPGSRSARQDQAPRELVSKMRMTGYRASAGSVSGAVMFTVTCGWSRGRDAAARPNATAAHPSRPG